MRRPPIESCFLFIAALALSPRADALIVRDFDAAIHKRLLNFPGFVYHVTPSPNPDFIANAKLLRGIGWPDDPREWTRQMALVSPRHILFATHYTLNPAWQIIFAGNDGKQHRYGIQSQTPVLNTHGKPTDLMVVTLTSPVDTTLGITPFPVLNLTHDSDYVGKPLLVCGSFVDSGFGKIGGHGYIDETGLDTTRYLYFDYDSSAKDGNASDCRYYFGDSGAPSFVMVGGHPALVGTCSSADDLTPDDGVEGPVIRNFMSSLHTYFNQVDTFMGHQGYHLKRFYPATTRVATVPIPGGALRQSKAGSVYFTTTNSGGASAHNVELRLTFSSAPASVGGTDWICNSITPLEWSCRIGGVSKGSSNSLTAIWKKLPASAKLKISVVQTYDGATPVTTVARLPLALN